MSNLDGSGRKATSRFVDTQDAAHLLWQEPMGHDINATDSWKAREFAATDVKRILKPDPDEPPRSIGRHSHLASPASHPTTSMCLEVAARSFCWKRRTACPSLTAVKKLRIGTTTDGIAHACAYRIDKDKLAIPHFLKVEIWRIVDHSPG